MKFTMFASGETDAPRTPRGDVLAGDPVSGFRGAARASQLAWVSVDPSRQCHLPFGVFPALEVAAVNMFDVLVHGWDIADAVDRAYRIPADLLPGAIGMARRRVTADAVATGQFAEVTSAAGVAESPVSEQVLLKLTGRRRKRYVEILAAEHEGVHFTVGGVWGCRDDSGPAEVSPSSWDSLSRWGGAPKVTSMSWKPMLR
jgi:uncharacterized protein (TIGR03086 family)